MSCPSCGFDASGWSPADVQRTLAHVIRPWFGQLVEGARPDVLVALAGTQDRLDALSRMDPGTEVIHEAWRLLGEAGRTRQTMGDGVRPAHGVVQQVNTSPGGVPKLPVPAALVTAQGLTGDRQRNRMHHGRPWQAICLWSADVIDALVAEGHPITYGSAGENITVRGIDWSTIRPGLRLQVGSALLETTPYAIPCTKNAQWFSDGDFRRIAYEVAPGSSRIYARVLGMGRIRARDDVIVEPSLVPAPRTAEQPAFPLPR
jgi:MOSC domain-containing protein YiiM